MVLFRESIPLFSSETQHTIDRMISNIISYDDYIYSCHHTTGKQTNIVDDIVKKTKKSSYPKGMETMSTDEQNNVVITSLKWYKP